MQVSRRRPFLIYEDKLHEQKKDPYETQRADARGGTAGPGPGQVPHRDQRPGRDHRRRVAQGAADAGLRRGRLRQDAAGDGVPRPRGHAVQRAGRVHVLRGDGRGTGQERRVAWASTSRSSSRQKKLAMDYVRVERSEIEETGEYDLEGLFVRLGYAIDSIGAKRVVLDTIESLFAGLPNEAILRAELRRLFRWLKDKGVTAIITGERGQGTLTRHGLEEYVSDCVIMLDHRVDRADLHPPAAGRQVPRQHPRHQRVPLPDRRARHQRAADHLAGPEAHGLRRADLQRASPAGRHAGGQGLLSRQQHPGLRHGRHGQDQHGRALRRGRLPAGREAACTSPSRNAEAQIMRNMRSIGIDLEPCVKKGLLQFHASRPTTLRAGDAPGDDAQDRSTEFQPAVVVVDPVTNLISAGARRRGHGHADAADRLS